MGSVFKRRTLCNVLPPLNSGEKRSRPIGWSSSLQGEALAVEGPAVAAGKPGFSTAAVHSANCGTKPSKAQRPLITLEVFSDFAGLYPFSKDRPLIGDVGVHSCPFSNSLGL